MDLKAVWARWWGGEVSGEETGFTAILAIEYAFFLTILLVWLHAAPLSVSTEIRVYVLAWGAVPFCALAGAFLVHARGVAGGSAVAYVALFASANALGWVAVAVALRWGSDGGPRPEPTMLRAALAFVPIAANVLAVACLPPRRLPEVAAAPWIAVLLGTALLVVALPSAPSVAHAAVATAGGAALALIPRWRRPPRLLLLAADAAVLAAIAGLLFDPHLHSDLFHQGGFLGPISEVQRGGTVLVHAFSQYGVVWIPLLAVVLEWLPWPPSYVGFTALLSLIAIAQYALVYGLLRHLGVSFRIAVLAMGSIFLMNFIGLGGAIHGHPSLGPMRFGLPWLLLPCIALRARRPSWRRASEAAESGVLALASLWSVETFVSTLATFGAIVLFESLSPARRPSVVAMLARRLAMAGAAVLVAHVLFALGVRLRSGVWPQWDLYLLVFRVSAGIHVAARLAEGDAARQLLPVGPWLAALFACVGSFVGCLVALLRARTPRQEAALTLVFGATVLAVSQFTMYVGSSVPQRLAVVSIAPIFVAAFWLDRMKRFRVASLMACTAAGLAAFQMGGVLGEWMEHDSPRSLVASRSFARFTHGCDDFPRCLREPPPHLMKTRAAEELLQEHAEDAQALLLLGGNGSATTEVLIRTGRRNAVPLNAPYQDSHFPRNAHRVATSSLRLEPGDVVIYRLGMEKRTSPIYRLERKLLDRACREFRCRRIDEAGFFGVLRIEARRPPGRRRERARSRRRGRRREGNARRPGGAPHPDIVRERAGAGSAPRGDSASRRAGRATGAAEGRRPPSSYPRRQRRGGVLARTPLTGLRGLAALLLLATPCGAGAVTFFLDAAHGRVVDEDTGVPIAGATVVEWVRGAGRMGGPQPSYHARFATTDAEGRFAFAEEFAWSPRMWLFRTYAPVYGWYHPSYGLEMERPRVGEGGTLQLEGSLRRSHLRLAALRPWCYGQREDDPASARLREIACPLDAHDTWPSGVPRAEGETDGQGRRTGAWTFRYEDGSVAARGAYREGGAVGDWEFYDRNGLRVR